MIENKQQSEFKTFYNIISTAADNKLTPDALSKNPSLRKEFVDAASQLGYGGEPDEEERASLLLDRRGKALVRSITPDVLASYAAEAEDDPEMRSELSGFFIHALGHYGLSRDTLFNDSDNKSKERGVTQPPVDLEPHVSHDHEAFLSSLLADTGKNRFTDQTINGFGRAFNTIYYPASRYDRNAVGGQVWLNAIATRNMYIHALATALTKVPPQQRHGITHSIREVGGIMQDEAKNKQFLSAEKGARLELVSYEKLQQAKDMLGLSDIRQSSLEEDIREGFDIGVTRSNGNLYYIDVKSDGSFGRLLEEGDSTIKQPKSNGRPIQGLAIKQSKRLDDNGNPVPVIVVDAVSTGYNGQDTRAYTFSSPETFLRTVDAGMRVVDAIHQKQLQNA